MDRIGSYQNNDENVIFGLRTIEIILKQKSQQLLKLIAKKDSVNKRITTIINEARKLNVPVAIVESKEFEKYHVKNENIIGICKASNGWKEETFLNWLDQIEKVCLIILDEVTDPQNLGAILRTVSALEATAVIVPKSNAVGLTPTVRKIACGGAELMPFIMVTNLARFIRILKEKNIWIYGACANAMESLTEAQFPKRLALIFGSEGKGLRRLTRELCDFEISIPIQPAIGSLNVSVATGIVLYEVMRQQKLKN